MAPSSEGSGTSPRRLLVVRLSALGDVIHAIPAVAALRDHFRIEWAVEAPYRELVEIVAGVTAVSVSLKRWSFAKIAEARRGVRGHEVAVDFQGLIKSSLLARASGARLRYGFDARFIREKPAAWFVNRPVAVTAASHVVEWNLALANAVAAGEGFPFVPLEEASLQSAFRGFALGDGSGATGAVVLLPGAGRPEKLWPVERFAELARGLGGRALAVWGPGEEERAHAIGCRVAPKTNLRELAAILASAAVVVGGDTGPLHLAAALGTPVVGLFGPTDPRRNGPYGQVDRCVSSFGESNSMESIESVAVLARTQQVMAAR